MMLKSNLINSGIIWKNRIRNLKKKMNNVLIVYKQLELQFEINENNGMVTLSYNEKPSIQAIANTAEDLQYLANDTSNPCLPKTLSTYLSE